MLCRWFACQIPLGCQHSSRQVRNGGDVGGRLTPQRLCTWQPGGGDEDDRSSRSEHLRSSASAEGSTPRGDVERSALALLLTCRGRGRNSIQPKIDASFRIFRSWLRRMWHNAAFTFESGSRNSFEGTCARCESHLHFASSWKKLFLADATKGSRHKQHDIRLIVSCSRRRSSK